MIVSMYMRSEPVTVGPDIDGADAAQLMSRHRIRRLPVVKGSRLIGVVSRTDLMRNAPVHAPNLFAAEPLARATLGFTVRQVMTTDVVTVDQDDPIEHAARLLDDPAVGMLPVLDGDALVGVLSQSDLVRAFRAIVFDEEATRITLEAPRELDVAAMTIPRCLEAGVVLRSYAEHVQGRRRYVLLSLVGNLDDLLSDIAWHDGIRLLHVARPPTRTSNSG